MNKLVTIENIGQLGYLDTYANLLYKSGQKEDALKWQEKAVSMDPSNRYKKQALEHMKKGEPTYGVTW